MSKVLVTGGAGFVGSFLVDGLIEAGHEVRILDNLEPVVHAGKKPAYLNEKAEFVKGDVRNKADWEAALEGVEKVFHGAALVGIEPSMKDPLKFTEVNVKGTTLLYDILKEGKFNVNKVVVPSSVAVYGEGWYRGKDGKLISEFRSPEKLAQQKWELENDAGEVLEPELVGEDKPFQIGSVYGLNKLDQEILSLSLGKYYSIPTVALRYFNIYGPRQSPINPYSGAITLFSNWALQSKPILVFEDGLQSRDFIHVRDIAKVNMLALEKSGADFQALNVGTGKGTTLKEIGEQIVAASGSSSKVEITGKYREGDIRHCIANVSQIKEKLGFAPSIELADGITETIEYHKAHAK